MPHTFLPVLGSQAMNSPRLPPGPGLLTTIAPTYGWPAWYFTSTPS